MREQQKLGTTELRITTPSRLVRGDLTFTSLGKGRL
jgi:hypothetical protein